MRIKEIIESVLDWRYHGKEHFSHNDKLIKIEDEMQKDIIRAEQAKKTGSEEPVSDLTASGGE
jgi:uncharacterized protein YdcH (DUF465 family)